VSSYGEQHWRGLGFRGGEEVIVVMVVMMKNRGSGFWRWRKGVMSGREEGSERERKWGLSGRNWE